MNQFRPSRPILCTCPLKRLVGRNEAFADPQEARAIDLALKAVGVAKVYGQDGGNDEGFAGHRRWSVRSLTLEGEEGARVCRIWAPPTSHTPLALGPFSVCGDPRARW